VGSNWIIEVVDGAIQQGGSNLQNSTRALWDFFNTPGTNFSDPKVIWDRQSDRFFLMALQNDNTSTSVIHLAVSPRDDD
jgi:hypothetical protein